MEKLPRDVTDMRHHSLGMFKFYQIHSLGMFKFYKIHSLGMFKCLQSHLLGMFKFHQNISKEIFKSVIMDGRIFSIRLLWMFIRDLRN